MVKGEKNLNEASPSSKSSQNSSAPSLTFGIIAAPEAASEIAHILAAELSDRLAEYVDEQISWEIKVMVDPFTGAASSASSIMNEVEELKQRNGWDYAVGISDLPFFKGRQLLAAEADEERKIAQISLPSLGSYQIARRVQEAILQLASEMHYGSSEAGRRQQEERSAQKGSSEGEYLRSGDARKLVEKRWAERITPIHRVPPPESRVYSGVQYVIPSRLNGYLRVTIGMVGANHPMKIFTAFQSVIATAFTTGAFALIFPTLWTLADRYEVWRSIVLMISAIIGLTAWIIISHNLWEKKASRSKFTPVMRNLYNLTTVMTLGIGVIFYYLVLLLCFFFAMLLFIPLPMVETDAGVGHAVGPWYFFSLAWITTSLATWIGALGAGLADEEKVLRATYGHRQLEQKKKAKKEREEEKEAEKRTQ